MRENEAWILALNQANDRAEKAEADKAELLEHIRHTVSCGLVCPRCKKQALDLIARMEETK
jgi:hypothetical protein